MPKEKPTSKVKLTNRRVKETVASIMRIGALSGAAKANYALAKNLNRLKAVQKDADDAIKAIYSKHFGDAPSVKDTDPKFPEFNKEVTTVLDIEVEYEPHRFASEDLNLDVNSIAPADLEAIGWLLTDF
jgi:hypothetical protein